MVRMRFQPPMRAQAPTPVLKPQRFLTGTAVANPVEGRAGHIDSFNAVSGVYTLVYHDGHREDIADADVDRLVVAHRGAPRLDDEELLELPPDDNADPLNLLNEVVHKVVRTYEGHESTIVGTVAAYLKDVDRYRVAYENCQLEDMTPAQAKQLAQRTKRKLQGDVTVDADEEQARKKHKVGTQSESEPPLPSRQFASRSEAYTIVRKAVRSILLQDEVKKMASDKQRLIIKNDDIRPKKALEQFIDADGLKLLQKVLVLWMKRADTHSGAMLVLKILAATPGVTVEAVLASNIGKTLNGIKRVSRTMDHVNPALGDLADWVIRCWKRQVRDGPGSTKRMAIENAAEVKGSVLPALYVAPKAAHRKLKQREAMTSHLRQLMTAPLPEPAADDAPEFFIVEYNKLGSIDKRRPLRQIIHIESLVERVHSKNAEEEDEEDEDEENSATDDAGRLRASQEEGRRRIRFRRRDEVLIFYNTEPYRLMETARSKIVDSRRRRSDSQDLAMMDDGAPPVAVSSGSGASDDAPVKRLPAPNKTLAPAKSILKSKRSGDAMLPLFSQVDWSRTDL